VKQVFLHKFSNIEKREKSKIANYITLGKSVPAISATLQIRKKEHIKMIRRCLNIIHLELIKIIISINMQRVVNYKNITFYFYNIVVHVTYHLQYNLPRISLHIFSYNNFL